MENHVRIHLTLSRSLGFLTSGNCICVLVAAVVGAVASAVVARQAAPRPPLQSDFGPIQDSAQSRPATLPATQAARIEPSTLPSRYYLAGDEEIGGAIERGAAFLLSQFKDGELATVPELSASQRQSLDALCVYALAQASRAISEPKLNIRSGQLAGLIDRLRAYPLSGDGEKMNRPITYGRSLRAAALATYDRQEDRKTLKADVQWLINAQVDGAYTYDDFYNDMVKQGMKPTSSRVNPAREPDHGATGDVRFADLDASLPVSVQLVQDFGGGSPDPGLTGPYGPAPSTLPVPISPGALPGGGMPDGPNFKPLSPMIGGQPKPIVTPMKLMPVWPRIPYPYWWKFPKLISPGGPDGGAGGGGPAPSKKPNLSSPPRTGRPIGESNMPPLNLQFQFPWDNSNSQYGLLGVWAGAEVGVEVPDKYWQAVEKHWESSELANGQWTYHKGDPIGTYAMTAAGVASLMVTHEYLDLPLLKGAVGRKPYSKALELGINWLDTGDHGIDTPNAASHYLGYDLYGIERVGLATGYKYFGTHNWYSEISRGIISLQFSNGSWGHEDHGIDTLVDTAYTVLFLSRGRHPVLMTKLKFDKYWDNRPRDIANLAKFGSRQLERQINWQVVGIEHRWDEWFDSPVVYIASHQAPHLTDRDFNELQKFAVAGGMIFTHADASSGNFDQWVATELSSRIAPNHPLVPIPDSDPLYSVLYRMPSHRRLMGISNGVRWLLVHSPNDLGLSWQMRSDKTRLQDFQLGMNVFLYAAGKPDLHNRLDSPFIPEPGSPPISHTRVARLAFDGNWNPEPAAWNRFSRWLQQETGRALTLVSIPIDKLTSHTAPVAVLTGTGDRKFSKSECEALAAFVKSGGLLIIDACGGDTAFRLSVRDSLLPQAFPQAAPAPMPAGLSIPMKVRPFSLEHLKGVEPQIEFRSFGEGHVVFSPLDLTHALLGTNTWGIDGYRPESAQAFLKNLIQWSGHQ
jgi:hypothetical protein